MDYYTLLWGPGVIFLINKLRGAFMCRSSTLAILADSAPFLDYYGLFWGLEVISTINEPRGAFTCRSLTLVVFADSSPFRGQLLTVLWSQSDFYD